MSFSHNLSILRYNFSLSVHIALRANIWGAFETKISYICFKVFNIWYENALELKLFYTGRISNSILVPRARDPFGQRQESGPLAGTNFLSMRRVLVLYSQPIRFDVKSEIHGLPVLEPARGPDSWR